MAARVVVAEDSPTQAQQLQFLLEDAGFEVEVARNGQEALRAIARLAPDIVVTDLEMPEVNGLKLVESIRRQFPAVPVVLMTAFGSEEVASLALQKGATSYVPKRYLNEDIVGTLRSILSVAGVKRQHQEILEFLTHTESQFALENDEALIPPLIAYFEDVLTTLRLCDQTGLIRLCVALREALINAIHHGNLEASSVLRETDDRTYYELVQERRRQEPYRSRRVHVSMKCSLNHVEFVVSDQGKGYDPSNLPDPTDPANLEKVSGRGLLLIRTFMDEVRHNENGTQITMIKRHE